MILTLFYFLPTIIGKHMRDIVEALHEVNPRWMEIGLYLGVRYYQLEAIAMQLGDNQVADMVDAWLRWNHNYKVFGKPSWKKLVEAIGAKAGGNNSKHAQSIAKHHRKYQFVRPIGSNFSWSGGESLNDVVAIDSIEV